MQTHYGVKIIILAILILSGQHGKASSCSNLYQSPASNFLNYPKIIATKNDTENDVTVSVRKLNDFEGKKVIVLSPRYDRFGQAEWWGSPYQPVANLAGDVRWGAKTGLLKQFGFNLINQNYTIPTIELANHTIEKFNNNNPHDKILLRPKESKNIESDHRFVKNFIDGLIPVGVTRARTYLHDINYHLTSAILLNSQLIKAWQFRAKVSVGFMNFVLQKENGDKLFKYFFSHQLSNLAAAVDQLGNYTPLFISLKERNVQEAKAYAYYIRKNMRSASHVNFIERLILDSMENHSIRKLEFNKYLLARKNKLVSEELLEHIDKTVQFNHERGLGKLSEYIYLKLRFYLPLFLASKGQNIQLHTKYLESLEKILSEIHEGKLIGEEPSTNEHLKVIFRSFPSELH